MYDEWRIDNVVATVKSGRQIHNVFTTSILQRRIYKVVSMMPQPWAVNSPHSISQMLYLQRQYKVASATSNSHVFLTSIYLAPTLRQLCEERQMWTIHGHMVTLSQPWLKVVKKFCNRMTFVCYAGSIL